MIRKDPENITEYLLTGFGREGFQKKKPDGMNG